jgi:fibronectin-binding autotransporter adhesin
LSNAAGAPVAVSVGNNNQSTVYSGYLAGTGSLVKIGSGTLTLSPSNSTFAGDVVLNSGTLFADPTDLQNSTIDAEGGDLRFPSSSPLVGGLKGSGNLILNIAQLGLGYNNQSTTYSGCLAGTVSWWKVGSGTLTLAGANTFSGSTTNNQGTIRLANGNALQNSTYVGNGGTLSFGALTSATLGGLAGSSGTLTLNNAAGSAVALSVGNNNQSTVYTGYLAGTGSLVKIGSGTLTLSPSNSTFAGDVVLNSGTLFADPGNLQNSTIDAEGGDLRFPSSSPLVGGLKGSGNLVLNIAQFGVGNNNKSTTYGGCLVGTVSLWKLGSGTLTLAGANVFSGTTANTNGAICLANVNALQYSTYASLGGTLSFGTLTSATLGGLTGDSGTLTLCNAAGEPVALSVGNNNQSTVYGGCLAGTGSLVKVGSGTLTLGSSSSTFAGDTVLNSGAILLADSSALQQSTVDAEGGAIRFAATSASVSIGGLKGCGNLAILNADQFSVGCNSQSTTYSGRLAGTASLWKLGSGALTLTGANTYTGGTYVNSGALVIQGDAATAAVFAGASTDIGAGKLVFAYAAGGSAAGNSISDQVNAILTASYNGGTDSWASGVIHSALANANSTASYALGWSNNTATSEVTVKVVLYGDATMDGTVNIYDLGQVLANYNQSGVWAAGDFNYDGTINIYDLGQVLANYNASLSLSGAELNVSGYPTLDGQALAALQAAGVNVVPEPGTLALLAAGLTGLLAYAQCRRRAASCVPRSG